MYQADIAPYGTTGAGAPIRRITLANEAGMSVAMLDYGAIVDELLVPDRRGRLANVLLSCADIADYERKSPYFGAVVGRFANRIAGARFALDGTIFELPANNGPNTLHGGLATGPAPNFSHRVWDVVAVLDNAVTFRLLSPDGENGFPGDLTVYVTYTLEPDNALRIDYAARVAGRPTVLNLTNHAYFNLAAGGSAGDHILAVPATHYLPTDPDQIPTGEIAPVAGTPMDFTAPARIGARLASDFPQIAMIGGYDHCYVLEPVPDGPPIPAATLYDPVSGRILTVETTEPGLQVYSGNNLDGSVTGPSGAPFRAGDGIALETQHFPDSPNRPAFPSTRLDPGAAFRSTTIWRFRVDAAGT